MVVRFLALGDSYTIGEAVAEGERWPVILAGLLRNRGIPLHDPEIIATTGWTTDELQAAIDAAAPAGPFELVSLLVGVNNQYRGRPVEEYRVELAALLRRAIGFAADRPSRVLVLSIPDWGVTPFADGRDRVAIGKEIDAFNAACRAEAAAAGARFVDITPQTRATGADPNMLAPDGLHPSGRTYAEWAMLALPVAMEALSA
jgi:lysophospholipase L1-like esterase